VLEVVRGIYSEFESVASCESVATIPAADFAPFHYGRVEFDARELG
jgi:hypothetical protein